MATKCYLLILEGQGDTDVRLVSQATWDWINSPPKAGETGWMEPIPESTPESDLQEARVTIGSFENDRALNAIGSCFDTVKAAFAFAKKHKLKVADEYHGHIY